MQRHQISHGFEQTSYFLRNVKRNVELKLNKAEACLSTVQLMMKKITTPPQALNAAEACFTEAADKVKQLRLLLETLCRISCNFTFTLCSFLWYVLMQMNYNVNRNIDLQYLSVSFANQNTRF